MTSLNTPAVRRLLRAVALTPVILVSLAAPAMAAPPEAWPETEPPSTFSMLLVLVLMLNGNDPIQRNQMEELRAFVGGPPGRAAGETR